VHEEAARSEQPDRRGPRGLAALWALTKGTAVECFRDRITGLAAEAGFWALLSLPPLLLAIVGTLGYFHGLVGEDNIADIRQSILNVAHTVLSSTTTRNVVGKTIDTVLSGGRGDVVSIGFILALWAGSRAMNVYVDTITIAYDLTGRRSIVRSRLLAFGLYVAGVIIGLVVLPLIVVGPRTIENLAPDQWSGFTHALLTGLYWPVVLVLSVAFLTTLYHLAVPVRSPWRRGVPGAALAVVLWVLGSYLLRFYLDYAIRGNATYGSLSAPVAVLLWLYVTALAVLIGAELNGEIDRLWPTEASRAARAEPTPVGERGPLHELSRGRR
jgi:membrane protein